MDDLRDGSGMAVKSAAPTSAQPNEAPSRPEAWATSPDRLPTCGPALPPLVLTLLWVGIAPASGQGPAEFFETRVRPLLAEKCFACHTQTKMGGLEMVSREALLRGGQSGPAVEPRAPERSLLIKAVRYTDERLRMPPTEQLSAEEVAVLTKWVEAGAAWPAAGLATTGTDGKLVITDDHRSFWAFRPIQRVQPPPGSGSPIDRFIDARLKEAGVQAAPPAGKRRLVRRVHYSLTGLPPTPEQVDTFLADEAPEAFERLVDRLLASPHYGERWGRHWLDVARYSDDRLNSTQDEPYENAWRYRDWVIEALNQDLPYDLFVKAQLAADKLPEDETRRWDREQLIAGLGMFGLSPKFQDDRIDVTGRGFLALTIACAQCHDHKFDPIPTEDYYALLGVFNSSEPTEHALAEQAVVEAYDNRKSRFDEEKGRLEKFLDTQSKGLVDALAARTSEYVVAAWAAIGPEGRDLVALAASRGLDQETLERWADYLNGWPKQHSHLDEWKALLESGGPIEAVERFAERLQEKVLRLIAEKQRIERENDIRLRGDHSASNIRRTALLALPRDDFYLWNDVASGNSRQLPKLAETGVLYHRGEGLERFLGGIWRDHVSHSRERLAALEKAIPPKYPFLHALADKADPSNEHVHIRGSPDNLGDEVPRRFLEILSEGEPRAFATGSGRLDLARAIASPENPLTARVMANRVWMHHFGRGIVRTPSNFGAMGERPTHPQLLDYLAGRLIESGWSLKALHREILLTRAYRRAVADVPASAEADPENRLLWRANRLRLDAEGLVDSILMFAGSLKNSAGGPPQPWDEVGIRARTVYGFVSRRRLDVRLGLFDFPNPNRTSPQRFGTNTPLQGLFFLNSELLVTQAEALAGRILREAGARTEDRVRFGYQLLFARPPTEEEAALAKSFVESSDNAWPRLAQVWLSSNEIRYVN